MKSVTFDDSVFSFSMLIGKAYKNIFDLGIAEAEREEERNQKKINRLCLSQR